VRHGGIGLIGLAALAVGVSLEGGHGQYRRREFTLDEEEAQSVHRMLNRARARRRQTERERRRAEEAKAARIAAEIEAARPKSRQELRARDRQMQKRGSFESPPTKHGRVVGKDKSLTLQRLLGKRKRRDQSF
jgi:sRNA-binding protein